MWSAFVDNETYMGFHFPPEVYIYINIYIIGKREISIK